MKPEIKAKIEQALADWPYIEKLSKAWHGFTLHTEPVIEEDVYDFFRYENAALHRSLIAYYHAETNEFKLREQVGLLEFCLIDCIADTLEEYAALLDKKLEGFLLRLGRFDASTISSLVSAAHITAWDYAAFLPAEAEGFSLFIHPSQPFRITNGSYIIVDYEDFAAGSNFIIYYNILRDDFFGEARIEGVPEICYEFDATNLAELEKRLTEHLLPRLRAMRQGRSTP
ncbi:MAG: hypothetical protein ACTTKW_00275 [Schwartzia sp. (in: firmicutes)]